jgi:hypothetical protein
MRKIKYSEGDIFGVPLRDGKFARGVVTRISPEGILIGYFFGPKLDELGGASIALDPQKAVKIFYFGDTRIINGAWPLIGRVSDWDRASWPSPQFLRIDPLRKNLGSWITYADDNPEEETNIEYFVLPDVDDNASVQQNADVSRVLGPQYYARDGMAGSGYVELVLTDLLE